MLSKAEIQLHREDLKKYIAEVYDTDADFPWMKYPNHMVFRHRNNQKWFALVMEVSKEKLGLPETGLLDILNVKCDPLMTGSFRAEPGIYPAYHMNKASWLSVALDGRVHEEKIKLLLDISFALTAQNRKKRNTKA